MMDFSLCVIKITFQMTHSKATDFSQDSEQSLHLFGQVEELTPKPIYPMLIASGRAFISEITDHNLISFILRYALCSLRYAIFEEAAYVGKVRT